MGQKAFKINCKNQQQCVQNGSLGPSWGVLGPTWRPSWPQELPIAFRRRKKHFVGPPLAPQDGAMLEDFGTMLGLCWRVLVAGWWSEGPLTQHEAKDGER